MKAINLIFLALFLLQGPELFSQGTLQLNQVLFIEVEQFAASGTDARANLADTTLVVPVNKVWKIESVSGGFFRPNNEAVPFPHTGSHIIALNGKALLNFANIEITYPMWLPAGSYKLEYFYNSTNVPVDQHTRFSLSIIEFNIVP